MLIFQSTTGQLLTSEVMELLKTCQDILMFMEGFKREYLPENLNPQQEHLLDFLKAYSEALREDFTRISPEHLIELR